MTDETDRSGARAAVRLRTARPTMREMLQERGRALGLEAHLVDLFDLARRVGDRWLDRDARRARHAVLADLDGRDLIAIHDVAMSEGHRPTYAQHTSVHRPRACGCRSDERRLERTQWTVARHDASHGLVAGGRDQPAIGRAALAPIVGHRDAE